MDEESIAYREGKRWVFTCGISSVPNPIASVYGMRKASYNFALWLTLSLEHNSLELLIQETGHRVKRFI